MNRLCEKLYEQLWCDSQLMPEHRRVEKRHVIQTPNNSKKGVREIGEIK